MIATPTRVRLSAWWINFLRHIMGLPSGEYVIVLLVHPDGKREVRIVELPEKGKERVF